MDYAPILCPHCAATTTLDAWEVLEDMDVLGVRAMHKGACGGQVMMWPHPASPPGMPQIEVCHLPQPSQDAPPPMITGYARICANRACPTEGLAFPVEDGDDLDREDRCPDCGASRKVYTERQGPGAPWRRCAIEAPDA